MYCSFAKSSVYMPMIARTTSTAYRSTRLLCDSIVPMVAEGATLQSLCEKSLDELDSLADKCGLFGRTKLKFTKAFADGIDGMASASTPKKPVGVQDIEMAVSTSQQIEESPNAYGLPPSTSTDADSTSTKTHVELPSQHTCE
jgi:hypothetical protein